MRGSSITAALLALSAASSAQTIQTVAVGALSRGPCAGAETIVTDDGRRYELEATPGTRPGTRVRIAGLIYPEASICGRYPWLRPDSDREQRAPVRLAPGSVHAWVESARIAADHAELGLPIEWSRLLEIDASGPVAALRALARTLGADPDDQADDGTQP